MIIYNNFSNIFISNGQRYVELGRENRDKFIIEYYIEILDFVLF